MTISPAIIQAAASTRKPQDVLDARKPKVAHTPGPWKVEKDQHFGPGYVIVSQSAGMTNRCPVVRMTSPLGEDDATLEADARLIAAAPDLLEIARVAAELPHSADCSFSPSDPVCDCHVAEARAAIAKATAAA